MEAFVNQVEALAGKKIGAADAAGLRDLGTEWVRRVTTAVLAVPSVLIPAERNYLLNPAHAAFARIRVAAP